MTSADRGLSAQRRRRGVESSRRAPWLPRSTTRWRGLSEEEMMSEADVGIDRVVH